MWIYMCAGVETYADVARETHHLSWINPESLRSPKGTPHMSPYTNAKSGGSWRTPGSRAGVTYVQTLEALFKTGSVHLANWRDKVWMVLL